METRNDSEEKEFQRDFLAGMIMLEEVRRNKTVSYGNAAQVATALVNEDEELPLHLLKSGSEE